METINNHQDKTPTTLSLYWLGCLIVVGLLAFGSGMNGVFVFDDREEILGNPNIQTLWPVWRPMFVPKNLPVRPLPYLSFAINYSIHGYELLGYHVVNLSIHIATAWIIASIIWQILGRKNYLGQSDLINQIFAIGTATLWMIHPLQTQPVNYIYQRIELMMSFFFMLTIYCHSWSVWDTTEKGRTKYSLLAFICCASGMLCKEVMLVAPITVLWFDRVFISESWGDLWSKRGRSLLALFSTWILLFLVIYQQSSQYPEYSESKKLASPIYYLFTESEVLCHYLKLIVYPDKLVFDYYWPIKTDIGQILIPGLVIVGLLSITVYLIIHQPIMGLVTGWFFILLGVTSSLNPVLQPACEHRLHLALLGPIILINLFITFTIRHNHNSNERVMGRYLACCMGIMGLTYLSISSYRSTVYTSYYTLWQDTADKQPLHQLPFYQLGTAYLNAGKFDLAEKYCREAVRCDPKNGSALNNLGLALIKQGREEEGLKTFKHALVVQPSLANTYLNLGNYYYDLQQESKTHVEEALQYYQLALKHNPEYDSAMVNIGIVYANIYKDYPKALQYWEQALLVNPKNIEANENQQKLLQALRP